MSGGTRVVLSFADSGVCPIGAVVREHGGRAVDISRNVCPPGCPTATTEFSLEGATTRPESMNGALDGVELERVFVHQDLERYRIVHTEGLDCPCAILGVHGCPIARYSAEPDHIEIAFCAGDFEELRTVIGAVRDRFPDVQIEKLLRSPDADVTAQPDIVRVDRSRLTRRQDEVLETAFGMGYFERPRRANAGEVAGELDIHPSTLTEHLAIAQSKLLAEVLNGR